MKFVKLPSIHDRFAPFYLAAEEWIARNFKDGDFFFAWQTDPTVVCGRHQVIEREVDLDYCHSHNIRVWRRKSGGGSIYSDCSNVMMSYITPKTAVETAFDIYTGKICAMLGRLGLDARPSGRNDVEICGRKVAGNAYYSIAGRSIVHGTMLLDADFQTMSKVLTPSRAKLHSKGVASVPARVTTLKTCGLTITVDEFIDHAVRSLCDEGPVVIDDNAVVEIENIMQGYLIPCAFDGHAHSGAVITRVDGAGEFACDLTLDTEGRIAGCRLSGDFFALNDIDTVLLSRLEGIRCDRYSITSSLSDIDIPTIIPGMDKERLVEIILTTARQLDNNSNTL